MCDPVTAIVMGARTALDVIHQQQRAAGERAGLDWQSAMAHNREALAETSARDAEREGEADEDRLRRRSAVRLGARQARLAAQGSDLSGSPLDLLADMAAAGEEEALDRRWRTAREAWSRRAGAAQHRAEAELYRARSGAIDATPGIVRSLLG